MLKLVESSVRLKAAEFQGYRVELTREGAQYRVTASTEGGYQRTRVFTDYNEASAFFDSHLGAVS